MKYFRIGIPNGNRRATELARAWTYPQHRSAASGAATDAETGQDRTRRGHKFNRNRDHEDHDGGGSPGEAEVK